MRICNFTLSSTLGCTKSGRNPLSAGGNLKLRKSKSKKNKRTSRNKDPSRSRLRRYEEIFKRCVWVMDRCNNSDPVLLQDKLTDHRTLFITALPLSPCDDFRERHFTESVKVREVVEFAFKLNVLSASIISWRGPLFDPFLYTFQREFKLKRWSKNRIIKPLNNSQSSAC